MINLVALINVASLAYCCYLAGELKGNGISYDWQFSIILAIGQKYAAINWKFLL